MLGPVLLLAAALVLAATARVAWHEWRLMRRCREQAFDIVAVRTRALELQRTVSQRERIARLHGMGVEAIDDATGIVRGIHKGIASVPFRVLESIPATRDTTRIVREIHDLTSDSVYGGIRGLNRWLGGSVRKGLGVDAAEDGRSRNDRPADPTSDHDDEHKP